MQKCLLAVAQAFLGDNKRDSSDAEGDDEESEPMTLCIAADCEYNGKSAIALCSDWRTQTGNPNEPELMTGADDTFKLRELRKATIMLAGTHGEALELAAACKNVVQEFCEVQCSHEDLDLVVDDFLKRLREVAVEKKAEKIRLYAKDRTGLSHAEFVKLPTDQYVDVWHSIRQLNLGADLLIAHVKQESIIVSLDRWGRARWVNNYGAIGNGSEIARAMLCLQPWEPVAHHHSGPHVRIHVPLEEGLYRICEAHLAAHKANPSSVGSVATFQVLTANYRTAVVSDFALGLGRLFWNKHTVPNIQRGPKGTMLSNFQSFATGQRQANEPDEL